MAATVLKSKRAVEMSVFVVGALVEVVRQLALVPPQQRRGIGFTADLSK